MKLKQGTGNVFRDLGFGREEAANLKGKKKLGSALAITQ